MRIVIKYPPGPCCYVKAGAFLVGWFLSSTGFILFTTGSDAAQGKTHVYKKFSPVPDNFYHCFPDLFACLGQNSTTVATILIKTIAVGMAVTCAGIWWRSTMPIGANRIMVAFTLVIVVIKELMRVKSAMTVETTVIPGKMPVEPTVDYRTVAMLWPIPKRSVTVMI